ncbi:hypothetical protein HanPSC8_Chr01g0004591 [Helianthus annuus]|nr:hypothetical protein HanPSC8_Chr01g0004591 [Helianthus annuus]
MIERFMQNTGDTCSITSIIKLFHCDTLWRRYDLQLALITIERFMQTITFEIVDSKFIQWMLLLLELIYTL